ncbi:hypothetical protein SUGI_0118020 [Cryptomeria japonica]|nr:hypothetical protein SUGI_0118020 [Cryptomeria japonica]
MPQILMGNHTYMDVIGKGSIDIGDNSFNDVLCVPHLTNNLLSIYQITHGTTKRVVEFTPDSVFIRDMETRAIIATGVVDHASWLYSFSDFVDNDDFTFDDSTHDDHSYCDGSDFEENFEHLNMGILTCNPVLESCISSSHIDITSPIVLDDADSATVLPSCDSVQQDIHCLPASDSWDDYMTDIAGLFMESYIADLGDIIDDIHLLFNEDDPSSIVVRAHSDPLVHSLHDHSFEVDMIVDTYVQKLEEVSLFFEETHESLDIVLHSSSPDVGVPFSVVWSSSPPLEGVSFSIDMGTLEQFSEIPFIMSFLHTSSLHDWGDFMDTPLVLFLPKGRNVVRRSWSSFFIHRASIIGADSSLREDHSLTSLPLSYGGDFFLTWGFFATQEPSTNEEVAAIVCTRFKANFPIFDKVNVNGDDAAPVYKFLKACRGGIFYENIKWNFFKFLIDKDGNVFDRYAPTTSPLSIEKDIKKLLGVDH